MKRGHSERNGFFYCVTIITNYETFFLNYRDDFRVAKTLQAKHKNYRLNANQELTALGMANFGAAFFRDIPLQVGFQEQQVNNDAGAKTTMASIFSAILIVFTLMFFTGLFYNFPSAILAAVVFVAVS